MKAIYNKKMPKYCKNCSHSKPLNSASVLCKRRGVVNVEDSCRSYRYDPLKRVPTPPADFKTFKNEDFEI